MTGVPTGPIRIWRRDLPTPLDPRDPRTPTLADVAPTDIKLVGRDATLDVTGRVLNVKPTRSIDVASTVVVTLSDPDLKVLNSPALTGIGDGNIYALAIVDSLVFQLVGLSTRPRQTTLTFESEAIHRLRREKGAYSLSRGTITRAQFLQQLCLQAGVDFYCPELNVRQKIQTVEQAQTSSQKDRNRAPGFADHVKLNVAGTTASGDQLRQISRALTVAHNLKASYLPTLAMVCAGIGESGFRPIANAQGSGYEGVFQANPKNIPREDTEQQASYFLRGGKGFQAGGAIALSRTISDPGEIATRVEASGQPGSFYGKFREEAIKIIAAFNGGSLTNDLPETYAQPYQYKRLKNEDSWTCMRRLADEVRWHLFEVAGTVYFMSPSALKASRPRMLVAPNAAGVIEVNIDYDTSPKIADRVRVIAEAARWAAPPGSVAELQGYGPLDGRWLVSEISRDSLTSTKTTITLSRFVKQLLEPAHDTATRAPTTTITGQTGAPTGNALRNKIVRVAESSMTSRTGFSRYSQAGALTAELTPKTARTDCSQWIRAVYLKAGGPDPGVNTFQMAEKGIKTTKPEAGDIMLTNSLGHCELYIGSGRTIGHGSPPIDYANVSDFPGHFFVTFRELQGTT